MARNDTQKWFASYKETLTCLCCGHDDPDVLEFHHVRPEGKSFTISHAVKNNYPLDRIRDELKKCVPLCANCHKKEHINLLKMDRGEKMRRAAELMHRQR